MAKVKKEIETCEVADQYCKAPANLEPQRAAVYKCFVCDKPVCSNCSHVISVKSTITLQNLFLPQTTKRVRVCNDCIIEIDGNNERVMSKLTLLSTHTTLNRWEQKRKKASNKQ